MYLSLMLSIEMSSIVDCQILHPFHILCSVITSDVEYVYCILQTDFHV